MSIPMKKKSVFLILTLTLVVFSSVYLVELFLFSFEKFSNKQKLLNQNINIFFKLIQILIIYFQYITLILKMMISLLLGPNHFQIIYSVMKVENGHILKVIDLVLIILIRTGIRKIMFY